MTRIPGNGFSSPMEGGGKASEVERPSGSIPSTDANPEDATAVDLDFDEPDSAADTRTRLVAAARRLFGEKGYDGASVREITSKAGANLGAVTYHFGSKEALYKEVIRVVLAPLQERLVAMARDDGPAPGRLEALLRTVFEHLWDNPDQARLMVEVRLYRSQWLPELAETLAPISQALLRIVAQGQEDRALRPGPPLLFVMSLMAQPVYFMLLTRRAPPGLLPIDPHTEEGREAYLRHMVEFALRGMGAEGMGGARAGAGEAHPPASGAGAPPASPVPSERAADEGDGSPDPAGTDPPSSPDPEPEP